MSSVGACIPNSTHKTDMLFSFEMLKYFRVIKYVERLEGVGNSVIVLNTFPGFVVWDRVQFSPKGRDCVGEYAVGVYC